MAGKPRKWVIAVAEEMTPDEAALLGKALGGAGYTGRFIAGEEAELIIDGAKWRHSQGMGRGGDANGEEP